MYVYPCPICEQKYYKIGRSMCVCKFHEKDWMVTVCKHCGRVAFSPYRGLCIPCELATLQRVHVPGGLGGDHRGYLRWIGQEGWMPYGN